IAGETLHDWRASPRVHELAGFSPNGRTVHAELVLRDAGGERLLGSQLPVRGTVHLLPHAPEGATSLIVTSWRYEEQVVLYSKAVGRGRFAYLGLHQDAGAYDDPRVRALVRASLMHVAGS